MLRLPGARGRRYGCLNGECVRPDECACDSGWGDRNCTFDQLTVQAEEYLDGLAVRQRKLPTIVVHRDESNGYRDSWRCARSLARSLVSRLPTSTPLLVRVCSCGLLYLV